MGRTREVRWGPRVIDLDLLLYNNEHINEDGLQVPHPRIMERAFVLLPLAEIAPELILPDGRTAREAAASIRDENIS
jgi:2-amino-4-hydroxy-6-hydroxymethyldihydropteridine diphosphokinase